MLTMQWSFLCIIPFKYMTNTEHLEQNLCCPVSLLHKMVLPDETIKIFVLCMLPR